MKRLTISRVLLGLSLTLLGGNNAFSQSVVVPPQLSQWNVNQGNPSLTAPGTTWFNALNWLGYNPVNGAGQNVAINQDFSPGRAIGEVVQTATMLPAPGTNNQAPVTLNFTPVNGTVGVSDGTLFWSQGRGSSSTLWTVTYDSGTNQITVKYDPAITANRTLTVTYGTATLRPFVDMVGLTERVGSTDGSKLTFSKVLPNTPQPLPPPAVNKYYLGVTDGTRWFSFVDGTGNAGISATYDPGTRLVTVTYNAPAATFAPAGRNIVAAYCPNGMAGTATVAVGTAANNEAIKFTRQVTSSPTLNNTFVVSDTAFTTTSNGAGVFNNPNPADFTVTYNNANRTLVATYRSNNSLTSIGATKTLTAVYTPTSPTAQNITVGNMVIGDISGGDRIDLRMGSLTFDNNDSQAQLNKIIGGPDEIASPIILEDTLALAVRTGGDAVNNNSFYISGPMSGTGGLIKADSGNLVLGGNNTYTGSTIIRSTGGTTFLKSSTGPAISSSDIIMGSANRDGHSSMVLQLGVLSSAQLGTATTVNTNQIADSSVLWFDAASGRNSYLRMFGTQETVKGVFDSTGQGVIENTESEGGVAANSVLVLNSDTDYFYNGFMRNKSSGASSGTLSVVKQGTGVQTIGSGNISYTGATTVSGGTLRLLNITNPSGNLPYNPQGTGGSHNSATTPRFDSVVTMNTTGNLELAATTAWTYGMAIHGGLNNQVIKTGASTVSLTGASDYVGATTIKEGILILTSGVQSFEKNSVNDFVTAADNNGTLGGSARLKATYGHGRLANTSAINLSGSGLLTNPGTLQIANAQERTYIAPNGANTVVSYNNSDRVNNSAPIFSDGGVITFTHSYVDTLAKANYSETLGTLNVVGGKTQVTTSQNTTGATSQLTFGGLTRANPGATVNFTGLDLGLDTRNRIGMTVVPTPANPNGVIIGGWATAINTDTANSNAVDVGFAFWDSSKGSIRAYTGGTFSADLNGVATRDPNANLVLTANSNTLNANRTINSLKLPAGRTVNISAASPRRTLTLESGGLIAMGGNSTFTNGFLTGGASGGYEVDVYTHVDRTLTFSTTKVSDNLVNGTHPVKLVKSGQGRLVLGTSNDYTGGTIINEGNIEIANDSALGASPPQGAGKSDFLTLNGGTLSSAPVPVNSTLQILFQPEQGITLGSSGGGFQGDVGVIFRISSNIIGSGGLTMNPLTNLEGGATGGVLELLGDNTFQGGLAVNLGEISLGGYVNGQKVGTNTFTGPINITGGTISVRNAAAVPASKPAVTFASGKLDLYDDASIGALAGSGAGNAITSIASTETGFVMKAMTLTINQDTNTTFNGSFANSGGPALNIDKRGKGILTLTDNKSRDFRGVVKVSEGTLAIAAVGLRGFNQQATFSSIGSGIFDPTQADGRGVLTNDEHSASNLVIMDGAALSTVNEFFMYTNRPFTIGVGQQGASLLANAAAIGNTVAWRQGKLFVHGTQTWTGEYDTIQFTAPNQNALLNLGGRNQGGNQFGLELDDNGTGKVSLQKTGDGQWVLGEWGVTTGTLVTTPSRNDFSGRTTIYQGTLSIVQDHVLGAAGGESVNLVGGNLDLINVNYSTYEALSMAGGRLRAFVGDNTWTGDVSVNVGSAIEIGSGSSIKLRGNISGKGGITKVGFGKLILEGNNTFSGGFTVQEGTLTLDYTSNKGSKLFDTGGFVLGGGRSGGTLEIVGGTENIVEVVAALNLGLGQSRIIRTSTLANPSNTVVLLNALENGRVAQGASLDIGEDGIVRTDRLNDPAGGLLGTWITMNQRDWATNATNAPDGAIVKVSNYVDDGWTGAAANTTVTLAQNTINSSITNTLRFNAAYDTVLNLTGVNSIRSDGILQTPDVGVNNNVITGGSISIQENGFGGNLMIHQNNTGGSLTIDSVLTNAMLPGSATGEIYTSSLPDRMVISPPGDAAKLVPGMLVTGQNLEPNTTIKSVNYDTGEVNLNQGRNAENDIVLVINGSPAFTGDTMVQGVFNRVRVKTGNLASLATGQLISGGAIPGGSTITAVATDFTNTDYRILTISQNITVPAVVSPYTITPTLSVVGQMYFNAQTNRYRITPVSGLINLYAGMGVTGDQIEPGTVISSIDFFNGDIFLNQGRTGTTNVAITVAGKTYIGDTMLAGAQNRVRIVPTGGTTVDDLKNIVAGNAISGGTIPASTTVTAVTFDNIDSPTLALLTISQNVPIPAVISNYTLTMSSRNGLAKYGSGTLVLGGNSTYTGATYITGGKLNLKKLADGGQASPIGASTNAAANIVLSGGILGYIGDSVRTDRGFQVNEVGGVEVARKGAVATFTGNLSGGVGGALGVLEKTGQGTLNIERIKGNIAIAGIQQAEAGTGGATNFGGMTVKSGTLQLTYNNPNSNENSNRFSASTANLTMAGGKLELVGMADTPLPQGTPTTVGNPSENRTQQFLGTLTLEPGASQIWVTGGKDTTTTLDLQNPNDPREVVRRAGSTVLLVENPNGGTANMTIAIPSFVASSVLPWATYLNTATLNRRGVNDFAAIEPTDNGVISADSKDLYKIRPDVAEWDTDQVNSEGGGASFSGTTDSFFRSYALRFFTPSEGIVDVSDKLLLTGGAILVGADVANNRKVIQGGVLTSTLNSGAAGIPTPAGMDFTGFVDQEILQYDLIVHNYNPNNTFEINSAIQNNSSRSLSANGTPYAEPVNLVQAGVGTTLLTGNNTYTGKTFITGGVLRLGSANALPGGIGTTGGQTNVIFKGGMLGLNGDFSRGLGTGPTQAQFTGSGGFAAYGGDRTVNLGGNASEVAWAVDSFVPGAESFLLNSYDADGMVRFMNPIDLGSGYRQIAVGDATAAVDAELAGTIQGNGGIIAKVGYGTLRMAASNTYTGGTDVAQGKLIMQGAQASPISISAVDATGIGDSVTLQLDGATISAAVTVGNKNSQGISNLKVTNNSTFAGTVDVQRNTFIDVASGKAVTVSGAVTGSGRVTVNDGGAVTFNGTGSFGSGGGAQGSDINGGLVIRNGVANIGANGGIGNTNVELGDQNTLLSGMLVDRSANGRSVLAQGGVYDPTGNGNPGSVNGFGAFVYENQYQITIDGRVYNSTHVGTRFLIDGENDHPERNGVYELVYLIRNANPKVANDPADDVIALRRVGNLRDARDQFYGIRVQVLEGTNAGKTYFLATDLPTSMPPEDNIHRILISTALQWKEDVNQDPNVSLLASAAGLTLSNTIDINGTNGTGNTTLGGSSAVTTGSSVFTGTVKYQGTGGRVVRLASETATDHGIEFSGVISEAGGGVGDDKLGVNKIGAGTVTLSALNTYHGDTTVSAGTLLVNGGSFLDATQNLGSGTGFGKVNVSNFGSVLGGNGTILGTTTISNGATLSPGDPLANSGFDTLNFAGNLTMGAGALGEFHLGSDLAYDKIVVVGTLTMDPTALLSIFLDYIPSSALDFQLLDWGTLSAAGSLADRLDLPAITSSAFYWDTSVFGTTGVLRYAERLPESLPPVHFAAKEGRITEDGGSFKLALELDWEPASPVEVKLQFSGTASAGLDYTVSENPVSFGMSRTKTITVTLNNDSIAEGTEKAVIGLFSPTGAILGTPANFTLTIADNDSGYAAGDQWDLRNPLPTNETLQGAAFIGSRYVAVGTKGTLLSSVDGTTWTRVTNVSLQAMRAVTSSGTIAVAVGDNGQIMTTTDGETWTLRSASGNKDLRGVVWSSDLNLFVAVGTGGSSYVSNNGLVWDFVGTPVTTDLRDVAGLSKVIAVGNNGVVISLNTTPSLNWSLEDSNVTTTLRGVAYDGTGLFVTVGDGGAVLTSPTGVTWTPHTSGVSSQLRSVQWDGARFMAVGSNGVLITSTDGTTWAAGNSSVTVDLEFAGKVNSLWLGTGDAGVIVSSANGTAWSRVSSDPVHNIYGVTVAGSQVIAVGEGGKILTSTDGTAWTPRTSPVSQRLNAVSGSASNMVAVGSSGAAVHSSDGVTWTSVPTGSAQNLFGVTLKQFRFCAVGDNGTVFTSDNGTTWTERTSGSGTTENLRSVTATTGLFVAVGTNGTVITSPDGVAWTTQSLGSTATLHDVTWTGSVVVAVGVGGTVFYSTSGQTWTAANVISGSDLNGVNGVNGEVVAVGSAGVALVSTNSGATWSKRETGTSQVFRAVAVNPATNRYIGAGLNGTIMTSDTLIKPTPKVSFTIAGQTVSEAVGVVNVQVNVSPAATSAVKVPFTVGLNSTAKAPSDYTITKSPLTFAAGETTKNIVITVKADAFDEETENLILNLGTPSGGTTTTIAPTSHVLTITDEFEAPTITPVTGAGFFTAGAALSVHATATGSGPLTIQWMKGTTKLGTPVPVTSSVQAHYTVTAKVTDGGRYSAKAINPLRTAGALPEPPTAGAEVVVVEQLPQKLTLGKDNTAVPLNAVAGGNGLSYRWFRNNQEILDEPANTALYTGITTKTLTIKKMSAAMEGFYKCLVTSTVVLGQRESTEYRVLMAEVPVITGAPSSLVLPDGRVGAPYGGVNGVQVPFDSVDPRGTPTSWTAAPLPAGLTIGSNGVISGTPSVAITTRTTYSNIKITAINAAGKSTVAITSIAIDPILPNGLGSFVGLVERSGAGSITEGTHGVGARFDLTTLSNGTFSGKVTVGAAPYSFVGGKIDNTTAAAPSGTIVVARKGKTSVTVSFVIDTNTNLVTGTVSDANTTAAINGWRAVWNTTAKPVPNPVPSTYLGLHNYMATIPVPLEGDGTVNGQNTPQGDSIGSANVAANGTVTMVYRTADNPASFTITAPLSPTGKFLFYKGLYTANEPGSVMGTPAINGSGSHEVTGTLTWSKAAQLPKAANLYRAGFNPISLDVSGGQYVPPTGTQIIMNAFAGPDNVSATFFDANAVPLSQTATTSPNGVIRINSLATFVPPASNPAVLTMKFDAKTGSFSGTFLLKDTGGADRKVSYTGLVIPDGSTPATLDGVGAGFFILNGLNATLPQKSGRVTLSPTDP